MGRGVVQSSPARVSGVVGLTVGSRPTALRVSWRGGLELVPDTPDLHVGQAPRPARVTDFRWTGTGWELDAEGAPGSTLDVRLRGDQADTVEGAEVRERSATGMQLHVTVPPSGRTRVTVAAGR
jgi:hypothetical protein